MKNLLSFNMSNAFEGAFFTIFILTWGRVTKNDNVRKEKIGKKFDKKIDNFDLVVLQLIYFVNH